MNSLSQKLLIWYKSVKRELPWRATKDPYAIWISEVMLQQTQVSTVIDYFNRWMIAFPTVQALANASLDQVMALWQGLGYYSRARSLYAAAHTIRNKFRGVIPSTAAKLQQLEGIGPYTSAAIASIAFGEPIAAVDGNVIRVIARLYDIPNDVTRAAGKREIIQAAQQLVPSEYPGDHNQAMMELGATICIPRSPRCLQCPLVSQCVARKRGTISQRPVKPPKKKPPHRHLAAAYCALKNGLLLVRRKPQGLLGSLWELPNGEPVDALHDKEYLVELLHTCLGLEANVGEQMATIRHAYTHFTVDVSVYRCDTIGTANPHNPWDSVELVTSNQQKHYGLTGVTTRILQTVDWPADN